MGHASAEIQEIRNPGPYQISSSLKIMLILFSGIGVIAFGAALVLNRGADAWSTLVMNHFYFLSLAIGGLFFAAIHWVTSAMWSAPVRRLGEAFTAYLPFTLLTFGLIVVGAHGIYHWTHVDVVQADPILQGKSGYLNIPFFAIRNVLAIFIWIFFAKKFIGNSLKQDQSGDAVLTRKNKSWSPLFLILFALTYTIMSFDILMSLDPHWFSTIFGVYCFAGLFYSILAAVCLLSIHFKRKGLLQGIVNKNHLHDLGKYMFAFTIFWAYIGFAQFLLIWYANLPEEILYFEHRFHGGWAAVSFFLLIGKFAVPFLVLLPREAKRNERTLMFVAWFMLIAQWIDVMWLVQPEFFRDGPRFGWVQIGMTLGFIGVFGLVVSRFFSRNSILAYRDPGLHQAVFHHHQ